MDGFEAQRSVGSLFLIKDFTMCNDKLKTTFWVVLAATLVLVPAHSTARATKIKSGFDFYNTPSGKLSVPNITPDPFKVRGNPKKGPVNTDTIVQRLGGLQAGATGTVDIELVALSLTSVEPVDFGGTLVDVFLTLDGQPSTGSMNVSSRHANGGTFDYALDVFGTLRLVDIKDRSNVVEQKFTDKLSTNTGIWSHDPPPKYPSISNQPPGGFFPVGGLTFTGGQLSFSSLPASVIPEPGTLAIWSLLGLVVGTVAFWRSRRPAE